MPAPTTPAEVAALDRDYAGYRLSVDFAVEHVQTEQADRSKPQAAANLSGVLTRVVKAGGVNPGWIFDLAATAIVELARKEG